MPATRATEAFVGAKPRPLRWIAAGLALLLPGAALADRVTVKGVALEGSVESITSSSVVMKTIYGKGSLAIPVKDVEAIETEAAFHVFHGDDVDTLGRVVGVSAQAVAVEAGGAGPTEVPFEEVYTIRRDPGPDAELLERVAVELAYWSGNYDLDLSAALATTDTLALGTGFGLLRERGPSRLRMEGRYRLSMQRLDGESRETTQNEVLGQLRQELDLTPRIFAFGAESEWKLPLAGASWRTRVDYTPSVTDWADDWLLRGESSLLVPLARQVSFKASILDIYNSSPAEGTDHNSFGTALGLSLGF